MGLFPSCCTVTKGTRFPNLGDPPFPKSEFCTVRDELLAAFPDARIDWHEYKVRAIKPGTEAHRMASCGVHLPGMIKPEDVYDAPVFRLVGYAHGWRFYRAWYYWCAHDCGANAVRREVAEEFNREWREQVRVDGFAGGKDVQGDVDGYHVDTVEGLAALAALLRSANESSSTTPGKLHELKCLPEYFGCVMDGTKRVELRRDDRGYEVGDHLRLMEWTGDGGYSGRYCTVRVTHVLRGEEWLARNTVALSIVHV